MTENDEPTRRNVLKMTGTAAVAGVGAVGAVGTASAGHYYAGQCVRITLDVQSFNYACPNRDSGPIFESGQEGTVWRICTTDEGDEMILFEPNDFEQERGWVREDYVESC